MTELAAEITRRRVIITRGNPIHIQSHGWTWTRSTPARGHNQHRTHEQRYRAAPKIPARLPCKHAPHIARGRCSRPSRPMGLSSPRTISPSAGNGDTCGSSVSGGAQKDRQRRAERRRSVFSTSVRRSPSCRPSQPASARCAVGSPSAPAAAALPHHAPAAAVERLGKARRRAPFVYPAMVRGWVSRRIGPLVLGVAVVREQEQEPVP